MIVKPQSSLFNTGGYVVSAAARLIGARTALVRRWMRVLGTSSRAPAARITFAEFIALNVIKIFADAGVPLPLVKRLSRTAGAQFGVRCPLATKQFQTKWRELHVSLAKQLGTTGENDDLKNCDTAFSDCVRPFLEKVDFLPTGQAARFWPLGRQGRVVLDPERKFGVPIDDQSGVPIRAIYAAIIAGGGQESQTVVEWLDVSLDSVRAAIAFEERLSS